MIDNGQNKILVSVIMCVYNTPQEFLLESVNSVLSQSHSNFELIIVDDNSSTYLFDNDVFKDNRIKIIHNDKNHGPSYSRNIAINTSKGKYIAILDSDDISLSTRLEKQVKFMEDNPDVVVCGTWFKFIGGKNHEVKRVIDDNEYYRCCLLFGNSPTIINPSVIIRKDVLDKHNIRFDEELRYGEDYKLWYQLSKLGRVTNLKEVLLYYRVHENQATFNNFKNRQSAKNDNKVKQEMMEELGVNLTLEEQDLLFNFIHSNKWNANKYIELLNRIVEANKKSKKYNQERLELRVHEQWISAIQNVKNPFKVIPLLTKQKGHRKEVLKIKLKQLF